MNGRSYTIILGLIAVGILLLSACSNVATATSTAPASSAPSVVSTTTPATLQVTIASFAFSPATVSVPVGSTVTWTNKDSREHTVTADGGTFGSGNLQAGKGYSFTFEKKGDFSYHCAIHPSMTGTVIVGP